MGRPLETTSSRVQAKHPTMAGRYCFGPRGESLRILRAGDRIDAALSHELSPT